MDFQNPLEVLHGSLDKTPQHWFEQYAVWVNKTPSNQIIRANGENCNSMKSKLVCFRGMISNQLNPEYFYSQFITGNYNKTKKIHSGLYCDIVNVPQNETILFNDKKTKTLQRFPMVLVNPPYETNWHKKETTLIEKKENNKDCINNSSSSNSNSNDSKESEFNIKNKECNKLIAKFYTSESSLKICDLVDVYGIWYPNKSSNDSSDDSLNERKEKENDGELNERNGGMNLSCIHVLYWKKVENTFSNKIPYPNDNLNIKKFDEILSNMKENVKDIRDSLIDFISKYFGNDKLVATYVLLNMISKVVTRKHNVLIGDFSLNLTGFSKLNANTNNAINKINELYSLLMPYVSQIDISIDEMNSKRFVPIKNHTTNELLLNFKNNLQILNGTSIILNQLSLSVGKLNKNGILNLESLSELIENKIVNYDFEFSKIPFETDCNIIVLSEKNPLLQLKCITSIKVLHCNSSIKEEKEENEINNNNNINNIDEKQLTIWRNYICIAKLILNRFSLPEGVCELVQNDFVNLRKRKNNISDDDLHYRLTLLRLLNSSLLKYETDKDVLKEMQKLEIQRNVRNEK